MTAIPTTPPCETFVNEVIPAYEAYIADPSVIWKAKAAAYMVGHFHEWAFSYYNTHEPARLNGAQSPHEFRDVIIKSKCPELQFVSDYADASKHRFLTRRPEERMVTTSTGAFQMSENRLYIKDLGRYYEDVLTAVVDFWRKWLFG